MSEGEVSVDVVADTTGFEERLRAYLKRVASKLRVTVRAAVNTAFASTELNAWVKRQSQRSIDLAVKISKNSLSAASAQLQAFTGITALKGEFSKFAQGIQSFFENLPALAKRLIKVANVTAVLGTVVGAAAVSLASVGPAVQGLGAAVLAIPGLLAGAGAGIAVLVVALKNAPSAVKDAASSFSGLKNIVIDNFWAQATGNVSDFLSQLGPQVKAGMGPVAAEMGKQVSALAAALRGAFTNDVTSQIFANISAGVTALIPAMAPFANILKNLLLFGTSLLPVISAWLVKIGDQFNAWLQNAMDTGQLNEMLSALGTWLQAAGSALASLGSIISGIATAALNAGIGGLFTGLEKIAEVVNSPAFQITLTQFFVAVAAGVDGLLKALGPLGEMFASIEPVLGSFISTAGVVLGQILTGLADAMAQPAFKVGLGEFFGGILGFVRPLLPVLPQLVDKLAALGSLAGNVLSTLGPVIAKAIEGLLPIFDKLLVALGPLIDALGPVLMAVISALVPIIGSLLDAFLPILDLVVSLLPVLVPIIQALGTGLATAVKLLAPIFLQLSAALLPIITQLANILMPLIEPLLGLLGALLQGGLQPLVYAFQALSIVMQLIGPVLQFVAEVIGAVIGTIVALFQGDFAKVGEIWSTAWDNIVKIATTFGEQLLAWISGLVTGLVRNITEMVSSAHQKFMDFWTGVLGMFSDFGQRLSAGWSVIWNGLGDVVRGVWNNIIGFIEGGVNGALRLINGMISGFNKISGAIGIPAIPSIPEVNLPRLAAGATVLPRPGGTAALLGEGGKAESVVDTGLMNSLLRKVLVDWPKQVSAMQLSSGFGQLAAAGGGGGTTNTFQNNFPAPLGSDPAQVAQEFVNRLAEKVGL